MYSIQACRICLQQKPERDLISTSLVNVDGISFLEHLEFCVNEVNWSSDDFPSLLCEDCTKDLLNASKFKLRCMESSVCRQKYIEKLSDLNKVTEVDLVVESVEGINEEPVSVENAETDDNRDIEFKIDIEETKVVCNETNEYIEKQEKKSVCEKQKKVKRVFPSYIDTSKSFCSLCNRTFHRGALWRHIRNIHTLKINEKRTLPSYIDKNNNFCGLCNRTFIRTSIWRHIRNKHISNTKNKEETILPSYIDKDCDIELKVDVKETKVACNETNECIEKQENKQKKAKTVCLSYIDKNRSLCSLCNRTFSRNSLRRHLRNAHNVKKKEKPALPTFIDKDKCFCTLCNRRYTKRSLWRHIQNIHTSEKNYKCDFCSKAFATSTRLKIHNVKHTGKRDYVCYVCGKMFRLLDYLKCHLETHENRKKYKCDLCDKGFNYRTTLNTHKQHVHTDRENWKYLCNQCGKKFAVQSMLDVHVKRVHLKLKEHSCPLCDKKFVTNAEVELHRAVHSNVKLYKCEICGTECKYKKTLVTHLKKKHDIGTVSVKDTIKRYMCDECPMKFDAKKVLERHKNSHSGLKPYSCSECDEQFGCERYVTRHLMKIHGISKNCSD